MDEFIRIMAPMVAAAFSAVFAYLAADRWIARRRRRRQQPPEWWHGNPTR